MNRIGEVTEKAGKPIRLNVRLNRKNIPDDELLADLCRVAELLGVESVSFHAYQANGSFSSSTIADRFGSWNAALSAAGLNASQERTEIDEDLFDNLLGVWTRLGRQPTFRDMKRPLSRWTPSPYLERFGSWNASLIAFARFVNDEPEPDEAPAPARSTHKSARKTPRNPNLRLRWKVLNRDRFKCKCGRSPATDQTVILHVDHIVAWSNDGETVLENLQTLCDRCNFGKGPT